VYYGMLYAHRKEKIAIDFEPADVAGWIFDDPEAMAACVRLLMESLPPGGEKKTTPGPAAPSRSESTGNPS